jgi:hypothetical protein
MSDWFCHMHIQFGHSCFHWNVSSQSSRSLVIRRCVAINLSIIYRSMLSLVCHLGESYIVDPWINSRSDNFFFCIILFKSWLLCLFQAKLISPIMVTRSHCVFDIVLFRWEWLYNKGCYDQALAYNNSQWVEISGKWGKHLNPEFGHTRARYVKINTAKKYISIPGGLKLRKPSILVVNWVSSCLSFFMNASTATTFVFYTTPACTATTITLESCA